MIGYEGEDMNSMADKIKHKAGYLGMTLSAEQVSAIQDIIVSCSVETYKECNCFPHPRQHEETTAVITCELAECVNSGGEWAQDNILLRDH